MMKAMEARIQADQMAIQLKNIFSLTMDNPGDEEFFSNFCKELRRGLNPSLVCCNHSNDCYNVAGITAFILLNIQTY